MTDKRAPSRSLLLAIPAFLTAGLAQSILAGLLKVSNPGVFGWLLFGCAALLFIVAFGRLPIPQFALGRLSEAPEMARGVSRLQLLLITLSIAATVGSLFLFDKPEEAGKGWVLYLASVSLFILAFLRIGRGSLPSRATPVSFGSRLLHPLLILAVLLLAVLARGWQLADFPFGSWLDEAINGLAAVRILEDPGYRPLFVDTMPSHFIYLIALSFSLFDRDPFALRLVTAALGLGGVVFAYLLFRRWLGVWMGLVAAWILAVMRYHLTFSRFGVNAVSMPVFELAALYFLDRALAEKKLSDFAWFGLTLGLGLSFYTAFRLFPVAVILFLTGLLAAAIVKSGFRTAIRNYVWRLLPQWSIAFLALLIAVMPVVQYAWQNRADFFARTSNVSIFQHRDEPDLGKALLSNTDKHLEMFNVSGDRNGRHNLPGAPMLDPVMGVLFILGAAYALWRWRDPPNGLMLLVFLVMLQNGVLSLDFEAPQSLRSIGVIPALVYFITLPLAVFTRAIHQFNGRVIETDVHTTGTDRAPGYGLRLWQVGVGLLLLAITFINLETFFDKQRNDPSAWAQHSAAETLVAGLIKEHTGEYDMVLTAMYDNHPTVRFLGVEGRDYQRWTVTDRFPLVRDAGRGVIILFDETLLPAYHDIQRIYPNVKYTEHRAPTGGGTVLYEAVLTPDDLKAAAGVTARYYRGGEAVPAREEKLTRIAAEWTGEQPLTEPFTAEFRSTLFVAEYGSYRFSLRGAPGGQVWIDEQPVVDMPVTLARATHALRVQVPGSPATFELWWQPPGFAEEQSLPAANLFDPAIPNSGLLGIYFASPDWSGSPIFTQVDPQVAFYFHIIPLPRPYSVEWTGKLFIPIAGEYVFALDSIDGSSLRIDEHIVVDNPEGHARLENTVRLDQGWHDINVRFQDRSGGTRIYLYWRPPGADEHELIPPRYLSPPMEQYPIPDEADP